MIKQLLAIDGVMAVVRFRDDGVLVEGYGLIADEMLNSLAHFAHDYKRMTQGNIDQLAMFTNVSGWTPPGGWIVRGEAFSVISVANLACVIDHRQASLQAALNSLKDAASW